MDKSFITHSPRFKPRAMGMQGYRKIIIMVYKTSHYAPFIQ